jgi:sulfate transport system permease protein
VAKSTDGSFWQTVSSRQAVSALELTLVAAVGVAAINAVTGTLIAWVLVRDPFPGRAVVNALIDLPFALPTIVAGITLLALWGQQVAYTRTAIVLALLFVTLPFVVRSVQPVLLELDTQMEEAAASLGAGPLTIFRLIVLPNLAPAIASGAGLGFARAVGEFGAVVLVSGNIPFKTQVASVFIFNQVESDNTPGAAAVAVVLMAISLVVLLVIRRLGR